MAAGKSKIIYTLTDEAPLLATCAFLPIVRTFTAPAGIEIEQADISVAARVLAEFPECLSDEQKVPNTLGELGRKCLLPDTNIIKLPNISASVAQLIACVKELQAKGYAIPDYPEMANSDEEKALKTRYAKCLGSAVNPVLREGNSDRRAPAAVKNSARKRPHSMGEWKQWSQTHVSHMEHGDFYHGEKSLTLDKARDVRMELIGKGGKTTVLKPKLSLLDGEIIDSMFMSKKALCDFYEAQLEDCRESGILFSLHVKATMMKVSHPIVFGHCVRIFYKDAFAKHAKLFDEIKRSNQRLLELDKLKTDFVGIVSHDFRTPLSTIMLAAKSLLRKEDTLKPERLREYLGIIVDQAGKLSTLAEDTLSIAKIEAGQLNYQFKIVNVESVIQEALTMVKISSRHNFTSTVDLNCSYVRGDQNKLRQVLQNLISNAVKYSPAGGAITVTVVSHDQQPDEVLFSVSDQGLGIPTEYMGKLFQKYSRVDAGEAVKIKGTGLGLWICREIIKAHGGRIWVDSEVGKGSSFRFSLKRGN